MTIKTLTRSQLPGWWRDAVTYQIFMPSFADGNGDGLGDFPGIIQKLPYLAELGVDAVWLTPFYASPQADEGYDVADYRSVDPRYGTLDDFKKMVDRAHELGLKIIIDIVPNHTSSEHPWFKAALAAKPGSPERDRYLFLDGQGENGELPPNSWPSIFGGSAWTRIKGEKQWYMHLFAAEQADLNWRNPEVRAEFSSILRFWLDLGVDGLRIDTPGALIKEKGFPDRHQTIAEMFATHDSPFLHQPEVHEIYREWHKIIEEYDDRCIMGEVFAKPFERGLDYIRPDEMNQRFYFDYLEAPWETKELKRVIDQSLAGMQKAQAELIWLTSSHDQVRSASRLGMTKAGMVLPGIDIHVEQPNRLLGLQRARALATLTMFLPGAACIYYGEELGLPDHTTMDNKYRHDPRHIRSKGAEVGRDGGRCPLPWVHDEAAFGFSTTGKRWLPQPDVYEEYAIDVQQEDEDSTLSLYRELLSIRREYGLGRSDFTWLESPRTDVLRARSGQLELIINMGYSPIEMPEGEIIAQSLPEIDEDDDLPGNAAVWLLHEDDESDSDDTAE